MSTDAFGERFEGGRFEGGRFDGGGADSAVGVHRDVSQASVAELVGSLSDTTTRLLRQEVALAKVETRREVRRASTGVAMVAAAGAAALLALMMLSWLAVEALSRSMDLRWALAIVSGAWVIVALALGLIGRSELRTVSVVPERTQESLREIPDDLRGR